MRLADLPASLRGERLAVDRNAPVFRQGDTVRGIFGVASGRVRLERSTVEGRNVTVHVAEEGDCFAESALFTDRYHCTAVATVPSSIVLFRRDDVLETLRRDTAVMLRYVELLSAEVQSLRGRLEASGIVSARERILQRLDHCDGGELVLTGTVKEWASELGLAHETLYRELRKLEDEGLIERMTRVIRKTPNVG